MNRYQPHTPRAAFAIAAVVLSLATMTAFVGAPSMIDGGDASTVMARAGRATPVTVPPRVDVVTADDAAITLADASSR